MLTFGTNVCSSFEFCARQAKSQSALRDIQKGSVYGEPNPPVVRCGLKGLTEDLSEEQSLSNW